MRRNRTLKCALLVGLLMAAMPSAFAHDFDRESYHPLRDISYPFHAVGVFVEYSFIRPIHWIVSQPDYDAIFGHQASPDDDHWEWKVTG